MPLAQSRRKTASPAHCTHRDVLPMAGTAGFVPDSWCPDCAFYKAKRIPKKPEEHAAKTGDAGRARPLAAGLASRAPSEQGSCRSRARFEQGSVRAGCSLQQQGCASGQRLAFRAGLAAEQGSFSSQRLASEQGSFDAGARIASHASSGSALSRRTGARRIRARGIPAVRCMETVGRLAALAARPRDVCRSDIAAPPETATRPACAKRTRTAPCQSPLIAITGCTFNARLAGR